MADTHQFLAMDFGAESGRGILVTLRDGRAEMEELHRFANRPVRLAGTLYWDLPSLYAEMLQAMRLCAEKGAKPASMSIDTWGVDFGLLDEQGNLLSNPVNYRDARTEGIHEYSNPTMDVSEIFSLTAYEPWPIASLFQLLAMQRDGSPLLGMANSFLNMPDLLAYFLTGEKRNELSILNTSNLMGTDCRWAEKIIDAFGLPRGMFGELISPATQSGVLRADVAEATGLGELAVIATCGHDTSAAVAAIPAEGEDWAFLSCGTWSILGSLIDAPAATPRCLELGFTNEYTIGGWYIARNILGLWLVQELRRKWDTPGDPWDYERMTAAAQSADAVALVDCSDSSLMAPADMEEALLALIRTSGQAAPQGRGALVRCVLESLALEYAYRMQCVAELTGRKRNALYMVGGGIKNRLLCQLTANACGVAVHAGADQCTALGNGLGQALALGVLGSREEIRDVMRSSTRTETYEPQNADAWAEKRAAYAKLQGRG